MFNVLFGDVKGGRLARLPYLGYLVLLMAIVIGIVFGGIVIVGGIERMMGGDIQQTQETLMQNFGVPGFILIVVVALLLSFANLNIAAKRIRDMGLPGWWTMLGVVIISMAVALVFPGETIVQNEQTITRPSFPSSILDLVVFAALLFVPGKMFGSKS